MYSRTFWRPTPIPKLCLLIILPDDLEQRSSELLARRRADALTADEEQEMYDFIRADDIMTLLKTKTRRKLLGKS
jgi:hypothetical protein